MKKGELFVLGVVIALAALSLVTAIWTATPTGMSTFDLFGSPDPSATPGDTEPPVPTETSVPTEPPTEPPVPTDTPVPTPTETPVPTEPPTTSTTTTTTTSTTTTTEGSKECLCTWELELPDGRKFTRTSTDYGKKIPCLVNCEKSIFSSNACYGYCQSVTPGVAGYGPGASITLIKDECKPCREGSKGEYLCEAISSRSSPKACDASHDIGSECNGVEANEPNDGVCDGKCDCVCPRSDKTNPKCAGLKVGATCRFENDEIGYCNKACKCETPEDTICVCKLYENGKPTSSTRYYLMEGDPNPGSLAGRGRADIKATCMSYSGCQFICPGACVAAYGLGWKGSCEPGKEFCDNRVFVQ